jgi:archaellum biogenesis protein FlaJ (TadC family)
MSSVGNYSNSLSLDVDVLFKYKKPMLAGNDYNLIPSISTFFIALIATLYVFCVFFCLPCCTMRYEPKLQNKDEVDLVKKFEV